MRVQRAVCNQKTGTQRINVTRRAEAVRLITFKTQAALFGHTVSLITVKKAQ